MVHIAASLLWPDLPFLVTSPDYVLGAQATIHELRRCLGFSSALNLFTTPHSLAGSDVLLHLPPPPNSALTPPLPCHRPPSIPLLPSMTFDTTLRRMYFNSLKQLQSHKWQTTNTNAIKSPPTVLTQISCTRFSARLTMVINPHQTSTSWSWCTNSPLS